MNWFGPKPSANVRPPAVAGRFYPGEPELLRATVTDLLAQGPRCSGPAPKAIIVPHAGYRFSGPIAASAYAALAAARENIRRVVLFGPAHFVAVEGVAASDAAAFATPLGDVKVDLEAVRALMEKDLVKENPHPHAFEHSLEVQLPFLQVLLNEFTIVPLLAGQATPAQISRILDVLWGGPETRLVISSDLSHYLECAAARALDQATAQAIEAFNPDLVGEDQACGRVPIRGLLHAAAAHQLRARTLDLRNSSDIGGPRDHVVGYGAFVFDEL